MLVPLNIESQYVDVGNRMLVAKRIEADGSYTFSAVGMLEVGHNEVHPFIASEFAAATPQDGGTILARDRDLVNVQSTEPILLCGSSQLNSDFRRGFEGMYS